jgi:predicted ribosome quality control (RQC) complex YloA/Tae2 family protein
LILANIYKISSDDTLLLAENYFSGDKVEISLDKRLTASQNAQKYFKKYNKLKIAEENLKTQIDLTIEHINYLENVLYSLENAIEPDIVEEIREELYKNEYIKKPSKLKTKAKNKKSHPLKIISKDGFEIYIGKNNNQNEYITFNIASKNDMWLHAKNMAGSHVIIKTNDREIPDSTLEEAASYAAYYSKGRNSEKVEVDYTLKYNVKKPSGSKHGYVIFHENYSLLIHPQKPEI